MKRIMIAGFVGGFVVFMWGAIAHIATPLGAMGFKKMADEEAVATAIKASVKEHGLYFVPYRDMNRNPTPEELKIWEERLMEGPTGLLLVNPAGGEAMSPKQLGTELATNIVAALLSAFLLSRVVGSYLSRVFFLTLIGLLGWLSINVPYWNWYGFPMEFTLAAGIEEVVAGVVAGLVIAWIVPPPAIEKSAVSAI